MIQNDDPEAGGHHFAWIDHTLRPVDVPAPVARSDAELSTDRRPCPICGHEMREHTMVRTSHDAILNCPVPHPGAWDRDAFEPVNEFGMVIHPPEA